ncbi:MAG: glycosyltransferase [Actinomycetota bacterium]|nr:glycosyltransferase [Actinomycetota bacterium]
MRVLFAAHGAYGHVMPLFGVAGSLTENGHDVVVATSSAFCPVVATTGLQPYPAGMDDGALVAEARRRWPDTASLPAAAWTPRMFCEIAAPAMAADLGPLLDRWRPDVVVREEGEYGSAVASAARGVPWVTHGWGSPLQDEGSLVELGRLVSPMWEQAGLRVPAGVELYGAAIFDPCPPSLYVQAPAVTHRHEVRPTSRPATSEPVPGSGAGRRHAYVGFGTVPLFRDDPQLTRAAIEALLTEGFDVTVTTGDGDLQRTIEGAHSTRVRVERWVQLPELLETCAVAVCHGGAGTVLSALAAGVPMVLLPRGAPSQQRMSAACERRGVGRAVVWNGANRDELRAAVSEVTSNERFAVAATSIARELAGMPDPSIASAVLDRVVRAMD